MNGEEVKDNLDKDTIVPFILIILATIILYLFSLEEYGLGVLLIIVSFILYSIHSIITIRFEGGISEFAHFLEEASSFLVFSFTTSIFALLYFEGEIFFFLLISVYMIMQLLASARNFISEHKHSKGWPIPLNAIVFSFVYYLMATFFTPFAEALFLIYYVSISVLCIVDKNFIGDVLED